MSRFLIPVVVVLALGARAVHRRGPFAEQEHHGVGAARQAGAGVRAAGARRSRRASSNSPSSPGAPWVLNVWGTWCVACREEHAALLDIARAERAAARSASTGATRTRRRSTGSSSSAIPTRWWWSIAKDARPSTSVCTARRKPFSSMPTGRVQYRHVGADDAGSLAARVPVAAAARRPALTSDAHAACAVLGV